MAKHIWTVCGELAIIDAMSNNIGVLNLIEQLSAPPGVPLVAVRLFLVSAWSHEMGHDEQFGVRVRWVTPSGAEHPVAPDAVVDIPGDKRRGRWVCEVRVMPVEGPGEYAFVVSAKQGDAEWASEARWPVEVSAAQ
jgi:hypothetical protein